MKRLLLFAVMFIVGLVVKAQTDLVFNDVQVPSGSDVAVMTVSLSTSETDASAFQCDVFAPEGVSILDNDDYFPDAVGILAVKSGRKYLWNLDYSSKTDGSMRFLVYGTSLPTFMTNYTSSDLSLFTIPFSVKGLPDGIYTVNFNKIEVANGNGEKLQSYTTATANIIVGTPHVHVLSYNYPVEPTCEKSGNKAYYSCSECGGYFLDANAAHPTTYDDVYLPALGHQYENATCTWISKTAAVISVTCAHDSNHKISQVATVSEAITKPASCTEDGIMVRTATAVIDGQTYSFQKIYYDELPALGHKMVYTDNLNGTHTGRCSRCGHTVVEGHSFADGYCVSCGAVDPLVFDTNIDVYDNIVYVKGMEAKAGKQVVLSLQMNNTISATGFQCDLVLPKGVTVAKDEDGFDLIELSTERTSAKKTDFFNSAVQADGSIRIMCSSTQSYTFAGNTGEVATIVVDINKDVEDGEYPLILKNVVMSDVNAQTVKLLYVKSTLEISTYTLGDANDDGDINVGDFTAIANYILGNPPASFVEAAADVNEDGDINVGDLTGEANLILYGKVRLNGAKPHAAKFANVAVADQAIEAGKELTVDVAINGSYAFSGCQFDMVLPAGVTVKNAYLSTDRTNAKATDLFTSSMIDSNTLRVVCASTTGAEFEGAEGSVARIVLVADNSYCNDNIVNVENVILSSNADVVMPHATSFVLRAAGTTGINGINADADATIYDLTGKKMNSNRLQKGVYVVNGKKIVK